MSILYSPAVGGFFDSSMHTVQQIPSDSVEVSADRRLEILEALSAGLIVKVSDDGELNIVEPSVDADYLIKQERAWRDAEIEKVKWLIDRHRDQVEISVDTSLTVAQYEELLRYVQLLRDWPQSILFPDASARPAIPSFVDGAEGS